MIPRAGSIGMRCRHNCAHDADDSPSDDDLFGPDCGSESDGEYDAEEEADAHVQVLSIIPWQAPASVDSGAIVPLHPAGGDEEGAPLGGDAQNGGRASRPGKRKERL